MTDKNETCSQPDWCKKISVGHIFWGLVTILIGVLALMQNFGYLTVKWANLWRLWPLIIVIVGLSIISFKGLVGKIISAIFAVLAVAVVAWALIIGPADATTAIDNFVISKTNDSISKIDLSLKTGASTIHLDSAQQTEAVKASFESGSLGLVKETTLSGNTQQINLSTLPKTSSWPTFDLKNIWNISVTRSIPVDVSMDIGASNANINLEKAKLKNLNIDSGASNIAITLGDLEDVTNLTIDGGASSLVINVPKDSGIQITMDSGLASKSLADLHEVDDNIYRTDNYLSASRKINITAKIGVSSLDIEKY